MANAPSKRGLILEIVACTILLFASSATAQISPGPLSRAHQSLNGTTNCTACHRLGAGQANFKCLDCHAEIATRLVNRTGLHATYHLTPGSSKECVSCHSEHNGENFSIVKWDPKTFDHKQTGYILEGKHAGLACEKCHSADKVSASDRTTIEVKDLNRTFLGISPACVTCHQDEHRGRLGQIVCSATAIKTGRRLRLNSSIIRKRAILLPACMRR